MTLLLKAGLARGCIEPLNFSSSLIPEFADAPQSREVELLAQIAELRAQLSANKDDLPTLLERAREEGRREGHDEKTNADADRLACLKHGIESALTALADSLKTVRASSVLIADVAIERLLGEPSFHSEHVQRSLLCQIQRLERETSLTVRVSAEDVDEAALKPLAERLRPHIVRIDASLKSGECMIDCRLGHVDLGLTTQQEAISALLKAGFEEAVQ